MSTLFSGLELCNLGKCRSLEGTVNTQELLSLPEGGWALSFRNQGYVHEGAPWTMHLLMHSETFRLEREVTQWRPSGDLFFEMDVPKEAAWWIPREVTLTISIKDPGGSVVDSASGVFSLQTPVPESVPWVGLAIGLAGVALWRKLKKGS